MVQPFLVPIPEAFLKDSGTAEWARQVTLYLDELSRPEGVLATSEATTEVVLTQQEKLDLISIVQPVNLDTVEAQAQAATTALGALQNSLPAYTVTNDGTVRTLNADDAAGVLSAAYVQAEMENIRDAVLVIGDVLSTVIRDLKNKGLFGV
jgi:hypothetical protein